MQNDFDKINVPDRLDEVVNESLLLVQKKHQKMVRHKRILISGSIVIISFSFLIFGMSNPVLASKIPIIGHIFKYVEKDVSYKGDFSTVSKHPYDNTDTINKQIEETSNYNYLSQTSNGITVTVSEVYYNSKALYLGVTIFNEEEFPPDFNRTQNMEDYILDYDRIELLSIGKLSFTQNNLNPYYIEGKFKDKNTFVGIIRIDLAHLNVDVPDQFQYDLNITKFYGDLFDQISAEGKDYNGNAMTIYDYAKKEYEGNWNFQLDVSIDLSKTQVVELNDTAENGIGIKNVEKTPYEISAKEIFPSSEVANNYFLAICDNNGDLLDFQGDYADTFQVYGRDTSTVSIFICDYIRYMDELKGYYFSEDYEEKKKTKTFAKYLEENCLYSTSVTFETKD